MTKPTGWALAVVGMLAVGGGGYWYGTQSGAPKSVGPGTGAPAASGGAAKAGGAGGSGPQAVTVEAVKVGVMPMPQSITAVGSVRSDESVTLRPEVTGRIAEIRFREGQNVAKGAVLVKLDDSVIGADAEQARANLWLAKSKSERASELHQKGFVSAQAKDEAEGGLRVAKATVQSAEARLAKMEIRAPFSGIIGLRQVSVGDYVKDGQDMVNLESIDSLKVDFRVPEMFLRRVQVGQSMQLQLDAVPGKTFDGKVLAINPLVDAAGRSIVIRAVIRNNNAALRPGMFARVRLLTDEKKDSIVVPEQALVPQGDDQFVFKIIDGRAQRAKVDIGQRREGRVEIVQGLAAADVVVIAGHLKIRDGTAVKLAGAAADGGTAQNAPAPQVAQAEPAGQKASGPAKSGATVKQ
ncbi:MAG: efflux RND transporter periplasmic adaptor subunit [Vicinamibacterales bacterium]